MKMYKIVSSWENKIEEVDVLRTTEAFVWITRGMNRERRESKKDYFDTWEEAKTALIAREKAKVDDAFAKVDDAFAKLEYRQGYYEKALNLTKK